MDIDSADPLPEIPKSQSVHYQFRSGPPRKWQSRRHEIRTRAKELARYAGPHACQHLAFACSHDTKDSNAPCPVLAAQHSSARYQHFQTQLKWAGRLNPNLLESPGTGPKVNRRTERRPNSNGRYATKQLDEDVALAHSGIPLAGDRARRPSLEREDAFYDGSTARGSIKIRTQARPTDDAEVAELYQMGLLYNSTGEVDRGTTFDINSIQHDEPTYIIRPSKRARKNAKANGYTLEQPLHLDLSFSDLGDDEAIVRYLMALTDPGKEADGAHADDTQQSSPPLRVIYELAGSQGSVDIDASQPPDLILDSLSDYDYLPDSEVQPPTQREETMPDADSNGLSDPWVILGDDS